MSRPTVKSPDEIELSRSTVKSPDEMLNEKLTEVLRRHPEMFIISNPASRTEPCRKITITRHSGYYMIKRHVNKRVEHEKRTDTNEAALAAFLAALLAKGYRQLAAWAGNTVFTLMIAKKGKVTMLSRKRDIDANRVVGSTITTIAPEKTHDRPKRYILPEGRLVPPLVDLGVLTADGKVVAAMRDKYRQINRFLEMLADVLPNKATFGQDDPLSVVDYGCGKSYLTFVIYYYLTEICGLRHVNMTGLDVKPNVVADCNAAALKYGYEGLRFARCDIIDECSEEVENTRITPDTNKFFHRADLVVSLHACDTATDYALYHAVRGNAKVILAAPCCQHELNGQMSGGDLPLLTRYGVVKERMAALMTDAIRANLLAACGYRTQLMEFVDLAHTPKNLLIRAVKTDMPATVRKQYRKEADSLCAAFGFEPTLRRLLF